ncbi:MAG: hypothetical protein R6U31_03105 [bacterium]
MNSLFITDNNVNTTFEVAEDFTKDEINDMRKGGSLWWGFSADLKQIAIRTIQIAVIITVMVAFSVNVLASLNSVGNVSANMEMNHQLSSHTDRAASDV